jgi:hypothetical protein
MILTAFDLLASVSTRYNIFRTFFINFLNLVDD